MFTAEHEKIRQHAIDVFPHESCGLIIKGLGYKRAVNMHPEPQEAFRINPELMIAYRDQIQAVVHSHPMGDEFPSESDMRGQVHSQIPWGITVSSEGSAKKPFFFGDQSEIAPIVGRGFQHGVTDCYSLIRDYYFEEFGERVPEIPRSWGWWLNGKDLYRDFLEFAGFEKYDIQSIPKKGDICFFAIKSKVPNHAGIYIGGGLVLHHLCGDDGMDMGSLSRREPIARRINLVKFWARYKKFI